MSVKRLRKTRLWWQILCPWNWVSKASYVYCQPFLRCCVNLVSPWENNWDKLKERFGFAHRFRGFNILSLWRCLWAWFRDRASRQGTQPGTKPFPWWTGSTGRRNRASCSDTLSKAHPSYPAFFIIPPVPMASESSYSTGWQPSLGAWEFGRHSRWKLLTNIRW